MSTATPSASRTPIREWRQITRRCRRLRDEMLAYRRMFPAAGGPAAGGPYAALDGQFRVVLDGLWTVLVEVEHAIVGQHPRLEEEVEQFVHGRDRGREVPTLRNQVPVLSRSAFVELNERLDGWSLWAAITSARLGAVPGARPAAARLRELVHIEGVRFLLGEAARVQHPNWDGAASLFAGLGLK